MDPQAKNAKRRVMGKAASTPLKGSQKRSPETQKGGP
jgi:hypothetical protein